MLGNILAGLNFLYLHIVASVALVNLGVGDDVYCTILLYVRETTVAISLFLYYKEKAV